MKTAELTGAKLDYWVAQLERAGGVEVYIRDDKGLPQCMMRSGVEKWFCPSIDWEQGGPIIERALISVLYGPVDSPSEPGYWTAFIRPSDDNGYDGPTPLIAAMRAYVASKFGEEVPDVDARVSASKG